MKNRKSYIVEFTEDELQMIIDALTFKDSMKETYYNTKLIEELQFILTSKDKLNREVHHP